MNINVPAKKSDVKGGTPEWVATLTILDVSGSISASQLRRLSASLQSAWRRAVVKRITVP